MTTEQMKQEALYRMDLLSLPENVISRFEHSEDGLMCSFDGIARDIDPALLSLVRKLEETKGIFIFHILHTVTPFGVMYTFLYVSRYEEEWDSDREDAKNRIPLSYVYNMDFPDFSEFGSVKIIPTGHGLIRSL